jgi:flagellar hook-associated protein 2
MTQTQGARDAAVTVNGGAVTGSGNTISGAIGGLDLTLTGLGSTTLNVGSDTAAVEANVQTFVDAYNSLLGTLRDATSYDPTTETAGRLQGDSSFTGFLSQLRSTAGSSVTSLAGGAYDSLAQIGITAAKGGALTLDSAAFQAASAADPVGVEDVFAAADGLGQALDSVLGNFTAAVIDPRLDGFASQISRFEDQIDAMEDRLAVREERLRKEWSAVEVAISQLQNQQLGLLQGLATLGLD